MLLKLSNEYNFSILQLAELKISKIELCWVSRLCFIIFKLMYFCLVNFNQVDCCILQILNSCFLTKSNASNVANLKHAKMNFIFLSAQNEVCAMRYLSTCFLFHLFDIFNWHLQPSEKAFNELPFLHCLTNTAIDFCTILVDTKSNFCNSMQFVVIVHGCSFMQAILFCGKWIANVTCPILEKMASKRKFCKRG